MSDDGEKKPRVVAGGDDNNNNKRKYAPDHGTSFIPGAGPEHLAPKSLDHFKRGYQERADQRDKEFYASRRAEGDHHGADRPRDHADPWMSRGRERPILHGFNVVQFLEQVGNLDRRRLFEELDMARKNYPEAFDSGKALTALISSAARRRSVKFAHLVWDWMDEARVEKNTFHYNSMISVTEKAKNFREALALMHQMETKKIAKNEVTFSSAISACEKCGEWRTALDLLDRMEGEGIHRTAIAYNAAISACEKAMLPQKACDVFRRMKREGITPSVVSYSALISAAEKGGQWKLALEILEEMIDAGYPGNVVAYSAAISALAKGQEWEKALHLFREIQACGGQPSIVTYNATMTALEKSLQWERALDMFEEMKMRNLPITVVSYGSAISACDKGLQYRQCLEFLDEMALMGIPKNVIIFGAAMSCMEKCSRADIAFQLMERMRSEGIPPNVHVYNSAISACARNNLWEKGHELFLEMDTVGVKRDVVTYNAVLDAVASQIALGRSLFEEGVKKGFYACVSRLGKQWFELDLHFLSLGGGEIALGWWFEECLVPYLMNTEKLKDVNSISIVTGYGKTRTRGRRHGDDGMRKRCRAMLQFMNIKEIDQKNAGRIHVDKDALIEEVNRNGGKVIFDLDSYIHWKETETTANNIPDAPQKIRARYEPKEAGSGRPPFVRVESETTSLEYRLENMKQREEPRPPPQHLQRGYHRGGSFGPGGGGGYERSERNRPDIPQQQPRGFRAGREFPENGGRQQGDGRRESIERRESDGYYNGRPDNHREPFVRGGGEERFGRGSEGFRGEDNRFGGGNEARDRREEDQRFGRGNDGSRRGGEREVYGRGNEARDRRGEDERLGHLGERLGRDFDDRRDPKRSRYNDDDRHNGFGSQFRGEEQRDRGGERFGGAPGRGRERSGDPYRPRDDNDVRGRRDDSYYGGRRDDDVRGNGHAGPSGREQSSRGYHADDFPANPSAEPRRQPNRGYQL